MSRRVVIVALAVAVSAVMVPGVRRSAEVAAEDECVVVDDFAKAKAGEFPGDWKVRKDEGKAVYAVKEENGKRFLAARSKGLGIQAAKEHEWDLDKFPVLAWRWRAVEFPKGGDERESGTNDSAAAVYLLVPYSKIRGPKAVKYVWSEKVPVGTRLSSNMGLTQVRVLRGGSEKRGAWVEERVNAREDFLKYFETKETPKPAGIAVLTDADDTRSTAAGDYADFRVCRK
jgi:hypothetical protein